MITLYKGTASGAYLPAKILPAFVDYAYVEKAVWTPFGVVDQLIIGFVTEHFGKQRAVHENYILPFTDRNKAGQAIEALLGCLPEQLDPNHLVDKDCYIRIEHRPLKKGGVWAGVGEVFPFENNHDSKSHYDVYDNIPEKFPLDPETCSSNKNLSYMEVPESVPPDPEERASYEDLLECTPEDAECTKQFIDDDELEPLIIYDASNGVRFYDEEEPPKSEDEGLYWPSFTYDVEIK